MTTTALMMAVDIAAILILVFAVYFPRHHRADLVVAFIGVNIGVLGVSTMLTSVEVSMGFGLGLFGVLSIIRLRSSEISQREIAYFFAALALGLICGLSTALNPVTIAVVVMLVAALALTDSTRLFGDYISQEVMVDRAISDEAELKLALRQILGAEILSAQVIRLDLVNDTTWVNVRAKRGTAVPSAKQEEAAPQMEMAY